MREAVGMEYKQMSTEEKAKRIIEDIQKEKGSDPVRIFKNMARKEYISIHGPEHHILDGASILTAFYNAGGNIRLEESLNKIAREGLRMPGAMCGLWGICGAIASVGAALSIIDGTGPLSDDGTWGEHMKFTSQAIGELGRINGPRCCKRDAMIAFREGVRYINEHYNVVLEYEDQLCEFSERNQQCLTVIRELREKSKMTQLQLAEKLGVSDKTISKWETGKGYPDITLLEPIAKAFRISVTELISGNTIRNENVSANMLRSKYYVCPVCGNAIHSMGEAAIHCHGILLTPLIAEAADERHMIFIDRVEDEYYVRIDHSMTKEHYISFVAAVSSDRIQMVKLYPEGACEARFKIRGVKRILFYCNRDGLYSVDVIRGNIIRGTDVKGSGYDDAKEHRE